MENSNEYISYKLNQLVVLAEDGKVGYENAAKDVKDEAMKSSFLIFSQERSLYAAQLRDIVYQLRGEAQDPGGDTQGSFHRVWMDIKSTFTGGDTDTIINSCITGEESAIKEFELVLNDTLIPESYKMIVREQLNGIEQALASIKLHLHK